MSKLKHVFMKKVKRVNLQHLHNEEHFQFISAILTVLNGAQASIKTYLTPLIATLAELCDREHSALEKIRKSLLTGEIDRLDKQRDSVFHGLTLIAEGFGHSTLAAEVEASHEVLLVTDHYGNVAIKSYNEETALIRNLISDLRTRYSTALNSLNLTRWVNELETLNTEFDNLMNTRFDESAHTLEMENVRDIRRLVDPAYLNVVAAVETGSLLDGASDYRSLIDELNARIDYYRNTLATRRGRKPKDGNEAQNENNEEQSND
jgi:hypothetical protein